MKFVFLLQHEYEEDGHSDEKTIGVYTTEESANLAKDRKSLCAGFNKYPTGFTISKIELDKDLWSEGFGIEE